MEDIFNILECHFCRGDLIRKSESEMICNQCESKTTIKDNVPFFMDITDEYSPKLVPEQEDKNKWTRWRKLNYEFFKTHIGELRKKSLVIDLGAGQRPFKDLFENYNNMAIDFYPYPDIDVVCDISKKLPLKDNLADAIISSNMLEHMTDPLLTIKECYRILKPGGLLILTVPFVIKVHQPPYDFFRFTNFGLEYLLKQAGFCDNQVVPIGDLSDILKQINNSCWKKIISSGNNSVFIKVIRKLDLQLNKLKYKFYKKTLTDKNKMEMPQGYGCISIKKNKP